MISQTILLQLVEDVLILARIAEFPLELNCLLADIFLCFLRHRPAAFNTGKLPFSDLSIPLNLKITF